MHPGAFSVFFFLARPFFSPFISYLVSRDGKGRGRGRGRGIFFLLFFLYNYCKSLSLSLL